MPASIADCEARLRDLAQDFRTAAGAVGWQSGRFRSYAETLERIALEILVEEDGFGGGSGDRRSP